MTTIAWSLLGADIAVTADGPVVLASRPAAVIAALLLRANTDVTTDVLIGEIWGEAPPKSARNSIARFVADARSALGEFGQRIETRRGGYRLVVRDDELDTMRVGRLSDEAERLADASPDRAFEHLADAISHFAAPEQRPIVELWRGIEIGRSYEEQRVALLERHGDLALMLGRHRSVIGDFEQRVVEFPYHEHFWEHLMSALARSGRRRDALRAYRRAYDALAEVGVEPSASIRSLEAQIVSGESTQPGEQALQASTSISNPIDGYHGLNRPQNTFIGRGDDITVLRDSVRQHRVTTIVGLGGSGKTRLAMELSDALVSEYQNGACRLGLTTASDARSIAQQLGRALGVAAADLDPTDPVASVVRQLAGQQLLLVLDNCEHILSAVGDIVTAIVDHTTDIVIVATSREPLAVAGEQTHTLSPLETNRLDHVHGTDQVSSPAARLFVDRAASSTKWIAGGGDASSSIEEICSALAGLPLAIEIAAAQMAHLRPEQLLDRLTDDDRTSTVNEVLDDVIEWTWLRLDDRQRSVLTMLSVCPAGLTIDAARSVCANDHVSSDLDELLGCGLITTRSMGNTIRFVTHEPVRHCVANRLELAADRAVVIERLAHWLRTHFGSWGLADLHCLVDAMDAVEAEQENLLVVLEYLEAAGRTEDVVWFATAAAGMWSQRGLPLETRRWLEPVDRTALDAADRSAVAASLMDAASSIGDVGGLLELAGEALDAAGDDSCDLVPHVAGLIGMLGRLFPIGRSPASSLRHAREVAERTSSPATNRSLAWMWTATFHLLTREYDEAVDRYRQALADARPGRVLHMAETGEAVALFNLGRREEAYERMLEWRSDARSDEFHYPVDLVRAVVLAGVGRFDEARNTLEAAARATSPAALLGRADDFQIAFGLIAFEQGERAFAQDLVGTVVGRSVMSMALLAEHVSTERGVTTTDEWRSVAAELMERAFTRMDDGPALFVPQLIERWTQPPHVTLP